MDPSPEKAIIVLVTASSQEEATRIGRALVDQKLAACANLVPHVTSIYRWEGKVSEDVECLMLIKTRPALFNQLAAEVRRLHSYQVPEIIAIPVMAGAQPYLNWIHESTVTD
ncbi:divalent-cation tolerance protein CutA [Candidatus Nitrospira bockiana]